MTDADRPTDPIEDILFGVLEAGDEEARRRRLERACAEHPQIAAQLRLQYSQALALGLVDAPDDDDGADWREGGRVGDYRLLRLLGDGGMGMVFEAEQLSLGRRRVAIKRIRPELAGSDHARERFEREARLCGRLDHPGVCTVFDVGEHGGARYMAMQFVEGVDLACRLEDARRDRGSGKATSTVALTESGSDVEQLRAVLDYFERAARALHAAHEAGLVHRDIKPANLMVQPDGAPCLLDFGLAWAADDDVKLTMTGDRLGTPLYMPPEQVEHGGGRADRRADVYSLGATLYEALTLEPPYRAATRHELFRAILEGRLRDPRTLNPAVSKDLRTVLITALARDPERRYATAAELADDLARVRRREPILAVPPGPWTRSAMWVRRNRLLSALVTVACVGLVVTTGLFLRADGLASDNAELAQEATELAEAEAEALRDAETNLRKFEGKVDEFNQLAGVYRYEEVVARCGQLLEQAAWPDAVPAMESWLAECDELLAMRDDVRRTIDNLRAQALPLTAAQAEDAQQAAPKLYANWEQMGKRLASLRYMQAIRAGEAMPVVELDEEQRLLDAEALRSLAYERVADGPPERAVWGEEPLGLAAALLSVEKASTDLMRFACLDTLMWAYHANGQDQSAKQAGARALSMASSIGRPSYKERMEEGFREMARADAVLTQLEFEYQTLTATVAARLVRNFGPGDQAKAFLHDALVALVVKLASIEELQQNLVRQRLEWAQQVEALSLDHPRAPMSWSAVREAIAASAKYEGQSVELRGHDVFGLVPLGPHPDTGYFEFYHLRSAWDGWSDPREIPIPQRGTDGSIKVTGATGIVFVLLPGGEVSLGAQSVDSGSPHYDIHASEEEALHGVTLAPFFLATHELTRGQWARLWPGDKQMRYPSFYRRSALPNGQWITAAHPVEQVSWVMCDRLLSSHGLMLPSEAQWEYGCRGIADTPWNCQFSDLRYCANVADESAKRQSPQLTCEAWDDGYVLTAPVGTFRANGFGIYDTHGNLYEWCWDAFGDYGSEQGSDGRRPEPEASLGRIYRGGSYQEPAQLARAAARSVVGPEIRAAVLGLRAARALRFPD